MTPEQFHNLDEIQQAELVWEGKHIGERRDEEHIILLFKKDDLYIEVYLKYGIIKRMQAFSKDELLDIYTLKIGFSVNFLALINTFFISSNCVTEIIFS